MRILVTGGTGFVGREVLRLAVRAGVAVRAAVRRVDASVPNNVEAVIVPDLAPDTDWARAVRGVDVVVHLAARVHVMRDAAPEPLAKFRSTNVGGTLALARIAAAAGVHRFVFLSSIKVNGERTDPGRPFTSRDAPAPQDAYAASKFEAEQGLAQLAAEGTMEFVAIRPPLVYGPGVGANFHAMMCWVRRGWPLPFGLIHNCRSLVARGNLCDLIMTCLSHPAAANCTVLVADGEDLSTTDLLCRLGRALHCPARLVPVPSVLVKLGFALVGRGDIAMRLCDSLQVDIAPTEQLLGWKPPLALDEALQETASDFLRAQRA
jgi:nucleoside-diphosphate-sugar epimerase